MKKSLSLGVFILIVLLSGSLFASGVGLTGIGARATALGGNFRGVANDWSAMYWNPAGITQISGMQLGGGLELLWPVGSYLPAQYLHPVYNSPSKLSGLYYKKLDGDNWKTVENEPRTFFIPSMGFVYSMENMSFGLGVFVPFGLGAKWDLLNTASYNPNYREFDYESDLQVIDIHPTFSYKVNEKLSVGAGVGVTIAKITIIKPNFTTNPVMGLLSLAQALPTINPAFAPTAQFINEQVGPETDFAAANFAAPYDHLVTEVNLEGDGMGFGFNFGVKYDVNDYLSVGLSGRYYFDISLDGTLNKDTYLAFMNDGGVAYGTVGAVLDSVAKATASIGGLAALGIDAEAEQAMRGMYSGGLDPTNPDGTSKFSDDGIKASLPLPMEIGLGVAYNPNENLLLTTDLSWTQWSTWDVIEIELSDGSINELVQKWDDGIRFGVGLEYTMKALQLRSGYYTEPMAAVASSMTPTIPDISRRHAINLGLSYNFGKIGIHGSYEHIFFNDYELGTMDWEYNEAANGYDNMSGAYTMKVNNLMFGLEYNF